jgi:hypothetical protein
LGDESLALSVTARIKTAKLSYTQLYIRKGERGAVLVTGGLTAPDPAATQAVATRAAAKL